MQINLIPVEKEANKSRKCVWDGRLFFLERWPDFDARFFFHLFLSDCK